MPSEIDILNLVRSQPGLKGREIAARLNAYKAEVNSMLWNLQNEGLTRQDSAYRRFAVEKATEKPAQTQPESPKQLTRLGRLCPYCSGCLSLDDEAGVRVFARSQYALDYVELPEVPGIITDQPVTAFAGADDLLRRLRNDRERRRASEHPPVPGGRPGWRRACWQAGTGRRPPQAPEPQVGQDRGKKPLLAAGKQGSSASGEERDNALTPVMCRRGGPLGSLSP